jgi:hypothetical protein
MAVAWRAAVRGWQGGALVEVARLRAVLGHARLGDDRPELRQRGPQRLRGWVCRPHRCSVPWHDTVRRQPVRPGSVHVGWAVRPGPPSTVMSCSAPTRPTRWSSTAQSGNSEGMGGWFNPRGDLLVFADEHVIPTMSVSTRRSPILEVSGALWVEWTVQYVRSSFCVGEQFVDLADARARAVAWCVPVFKPVNANLHGAPRPPGTAG